MLGFCHVATDHADLYGNDERFCHPLRVLWEHWPRRRLCTLATGAARADASGAHRSSRRSCRWHGRRVWVVRGLDEDERFGLAVGNQAPNDAVLRY